MEVPPVNTAVTDEGEAVIAAYAVCHKGGGARGTAAHQRIAGNATVHKRLADNATVHKRVAAWHSTPGKAGTSAEAASAARGAASEMTAAASAAVTTTSAASAMRSHCAGRNRRPSKRNRGDQCNSELI
jgi:hypothetical protein